MIDVPPHRSCRPHVPFSTPLRHVVLFHGQTEMVVPTQQGGTHRGQRRVVILRGRRRRRR